MNIQTKSVEIHELCWIPKDQQEINGTPIKIKEITEKQCQSSQNNENPNQLNRNQQELYSIPKSQETNWSPTTINEHRRKINANQPKLMKIQTKSVEVHKLHSTPKSQQETKCKPNKNQRKS